MNSDQIVHFLAAYREQSFAAAARSIPMSVQGFSKSMHNLERELGVPLFHRERNGHAVPTEYGERFLASAQTIMREIDELNADLESMEQLDSTTVRLGSSSGIMGSFGYDIVTEFKLANPGCDVICQTARNDEMCENMLVDKTARLIFTVAPFNQEFQTYELMSTHLSLWVNENDPLANKVRIEFDDLAGRTIALPGRGYKIYESIMGNLKEHGVEPAEVFESDDMIWLYNFAAQNKGLAFSIDYLGSLPIFADSGAKCIPLADLHWDVGISWAAGEQLSKAEESFRDICFKHFRNMHTTR